MVNVLHIPHAFKSKIFFAIVGVCVGVLVIGLGTYKIIALQRQVQKMKDSPKASQEAQRQEIATVVEKVRALIAIPADELPTIATVTDPEKLKSQAFFSSALTGDKVLIYTVAKKAILYRPSENKIIEVSPISIGAATRSATMQENVQFALYNGTTAVGLTKKIETVLKEKIANASVSIKENAKKNDYTQTILIDLTGTHSENAIAYAKALGYTVGSLPDGEVAPKNVDFLIILGADVR